MSEKRTREEKKEIAQKRFNRYRIAASKYFKRISRNKFVAGDLQNAKGQFSPQKYGKAANRDTAVRMQLMELIRKFEEERQREGLPRVREIQIDELFEAFLQRQPETLGEGLIFTAAIAPPPGGEEKATPAGGKKEEEKKEKKEEAEPEAGGAGAGQLSEEQIQRLAAALKAQYIAAGQPEGVAEAASSMLMRQLRGDPTATGTIVLPRVAGTEAPAPERQQMTEETVVTETRRGTAPETIEIAVPPVLDVLPEVDNAQLITRDAATGRGGFAVDRETIDMLQRVARSRGLRQEVVDLAPVILSDSPDWDGIVASIGGIALGELLGVVGKAVPAPIRQRIAKEAIKALIKAGRGLKKSFDEKFDVLEDGRVRPKQLEKNDIANTRSDLAEELQMFANNGTISEDTRDLFNSVLQKDLAGVNRTQESRVREEEAMQNLFNYLGSEEIDSDDEETRNRRVAELIGLIDANLAANETKVREVKETGVNVLEFKDRVRPETLFDSGAGRFVEETNSLLDEYGAIIDANQDLSPEGKAEMKRGLAREVQSILAGITTTENYRGFIPFIGPDGRFQAQADPIADFVNAAVRAPGMQPIINALRELPQYAVLAGYATSRGMGGAYASGAILSDFMYNAARGAGLGMAAGISVDQLLQAVNPEFERQFGRRIPPQVIAGISLLAGGAAASMGGAGAKFTPEGGLALIDEEPIVPPTLEIVQQDDSKSATGKGRIGDGRQLWRPKAILPAVGILEPTDNEVDADQLEWTAFDYVQPTSEGTDGTVETNVLKRQNFVEDAIRYQNAGVEVNQVYGMFPPYSAAEEKKLFTGPELPEMKFLDQTFNLSEYEVQSYDVNNDRTAIEMLSPYQFGTNTSQNWMTMPTSILYSVVP
jgi:ribosomal protein L12E/L44/L45/RPP1/RPP2